MGGKGESHCGSCDLKVGKFTIWNASKEGCQFYQSLSHDDQLKVMFTVSCDPVW